MSDQKEPSPIKEVSIEEVKQVVDVEMTEVVKVEEKVEQKIEEKPKLRPMNGDVKVRWLCLAIINENYGKI